LPNESPNQLFSTYLKKIYEYTSYSTKFWIAKSDREWFSECFITYDEVRGKNGVKAKAESLGLIKTKIKKFCGDPITHTAITPKFKKHLKICADFLQNNDFPNNKKQLLNNTDSLFKEK